MRIIDVDGSEKLKLVEGVQYGEKQSSWVMNNLDKFRIGLEAELSYKSLDGGDLSQYDIDDLAGMYQFDYSNSLEYFGDSYGVDSDEVKSSLIDVIMNHIDEHEVVVTRDEDNFNFLVRLLEQESLCDQLAKFDNSDDGDYNLIKEVMDVIYDGGDYNDLEDTIKPMFDYDNDYTSDGIIDAILNGSYSVDVYEMINDLDSLNETLNEHDAIDNGVLVDEGSVNDVAMEKIKKYGREFLISLRDFCQHREYYVDHFKGSSRDALNDYIYATAPFSNYLEDIIDSIGITEGELVEELIGEFPSSYNAEPYHFYDISEFSGDDPAIHIERAQEIINESGYASDFEVVPEGGKMIEIITTGIITGDQIEEIYDVLFDIIKQLISEGFETIDSKGEDQGSGFHINISMPSYKGFVDPVKFLLLSNIMNLLPEDERFIRKYVNDIRENFKDRRALEFLVGSMFSNKFKNNINLSTDYDKILKEWALVSVDVEEKFQTVNFQHMNTQSGRIEVRMYGGVNYEYMKHDMWDETIRSMYALHLASSEDEGKREYLQVLNKLANETVYDAVGMDISSYYVTLKRLYEQFNRIFPNFQKAIDLATASSYMMIDSSKYPHLMRSLGGIENKIPQYIEYELRMLGATEMDMAVSDILRENMDEFFPKSNLYLHKPNMAKMKELLKVLKKTVDDVTGS